MDMQPIKVTEEAALACAAAMRWQKSPPAGSPCSPSPAAPALKRPQDDGRGMTDTPSTAVLVRSGAATPPGRHWHPAQGSSSFGQRQKLALLQVQVVRLHSSLAHGSRSPAHSKNMYACPCCCLRPGHSLGVAYLMTVAALPMHCTWMATWQYLGMFWHCNLLSMNSVVAADPLNAQRHARIHASQHQMLDRGAG